MKIISYLLMTVAFLTACSQATEPTEPKTEKNEPLTAEVTVEKASNRPQPEDVDVDSVAILVNRDYPLPEEFELDDLVYPDVRFLFEEKLENFVQSVQKNGTFCNFGRIFQIFSSF